MNANLALAKALRSLDPAKRVGFVKRAAAGHVEASGPMANIGDVCEIKAEGRVLLAEVAAVRDDHIVLIPLDQAVAVACESRVELRGARDKAPVGDAFKGRLVDALAQPLDGGHAILSETAAPLHGAVMAPMARLDPNVVLETGIRAIDGLITIGRGQRVGIFSASGVGKTTLVRQLALQVQCDHVVLCLVGERGREVEAMWREISAGKDRQRYSCVSATSDQSAPLRARALFQGLALAEHWRDRGQHVLLILDSVTRFAMALREIGLAAGAPPTLRAYTPNVFATLPRVVERCGAARSGGSVTAIMTVLSETDDVDDPIVEVMKALLDGHIVLSRQLAEQGRFPAVDVNRSVSRQAAALMAPAHAEAARRVLAMLATYEESRVLVESGLYKPGANARIDDAIREHVNIVTMLRQGVSERAAFADTALRLHGLAARGPSYA